MNKNLKKIIILNIAFLFSFGIFLASSPTLSFATDPAPGEYQPLATLPPNFVSGDNYTLPVYLQGMFKFLIAIAGLLAVIMIVVGGVEYMTTDSIANKHDGLEKIQHAVLGLLLALISWLILYTINPKLLEFNFNPVNPTTLVPNNSTQTIA